MTSKETFITKLKTKLYHKEKIIAIKRAKKQKLYLPEIPESLEKVIDEEIDLFRDKDLVE